MVITSGSYKEEVIKKFMQYNSIEGLEGRFKKIIIYCANVNLHKTSMGDPDYGKYIFSVINKFD